MDGRVSGGKFSDQYDGELRASLESKGEIKIDKPLTTDFLLVIKHTGAFTALIDALVERFRVYATGAQPALDPQLLADGAVSRAGRASPAGEEIDPDLAGELAGIGDRLERQIHLVGWFFERYRAVLPPEQIIRYESIVETGGGALSAIAPSAAALDEPLESRNRAPVYDQAEMRQARRAAAPDGRGLLGLLLQGDRHGVARGVSVASPDGPFASARTFCIFIGYPRSGHSLIGSLLDAHPRMVVAHELDALKLVGEGVSKRDLYEQIVANAEQAAAAGREQTGYSYAVPGQWQGRFEEIQVLGDKKGGMSTVRLRERPELLDQLVELVGLPLKLIHVVRNPYDNIATIATKPNTEMPKESRTAVGVPEATRRYFDRCETVAEITAA